MENYPILLKQIQSFSENLYLQSLRSANHNIKNLPGLLEQLISLINPYESYYFSDLESRIHFSLM